jgi:type II secretory pathway pseudopilin PulG
MSYEFGIRRTKQFECFVRKGLRTPACAKRSGEGRPNSELLVRNKGFTLIEITVLIVMAGIIIPVIVIPFATGIRESNKPEMVSKAMYYAHQRMEELMKYDYCNAALNVTGGFVAFATGGEPNYTGQNNIAYVDDTFTASVSDVGYKMITVTVTDPQGSTYNVYSVVTRF